jgi:hypothetical protein
MAFDFKVSSSARATFNKYRNQWRSLKNELNDIEAIANLAWADFYPEFLREINAKNIKDPFGEKEDKTPGKHGDIFSDESIKLIYREVAKKSHPDKAGKKNVEVFKEISKAKKEGSLNKFLDEAKKIDKNKFDVSYILIDKLKEEIDETKDKIDRIIGSFYFEWYYAPPPSREKIMEKVINYYEKKENQTERRNYNE